MPQWQERARDDADAEEAETVRTVFSLYLAFGSMGALLAELDRRGIKTKVNGRRDGQKSGGIRFGVGRSLICSRTGSTSARSIIGVRCIAAIKRFSRGALYLMLQNRLYRGEVAHKGKI